MSESRIPEAAPGASGLASLVEVLGEEQFVAADNHGRYNDDWTGDHRGRARAVIRPRHVADVVAVVKWCRDNKAPLVPQGGHTGLVAGGTPDACGHEIVLSLERMNRVGRIDPVNGSAIVEAGCVLASFKAAVEDAGCYFPLSIGSQGSCQIGGLVSTNAGGINVIRHGMMRALVMGLEVVLPDGSVFSNLRGLHKDNTGYDLKQLFIGAEGTLGVVTAAALKLLPKPGQVETLMLACASTENVMQLFCRIRSDAGDLISAFELMLEASIRLVCETGTRMKNPLEGYYPAYAIVELSATGGPLLKSWVEDYLAALLEQGLILDGIMAQTRAQASDIWKFREGIVDSQAQFGPYLRTDISIPIAAIPDFIARACESVESLVPAARAHPYGHIGDGNLHFNVLRPAGMGQTEFASRIEDIESRLFALVDDFGGSISAEHGIGIAKRKAFEQRLVQTDARMIRMLKDCFDPSNIMNPTRIFSSSGLSTRCSDP